MHVTVEPDAENGVAVKLQTDEWEVNFRASRVELMKLRRIRVGHWNERRSIHAGESAGARVYWAAEGDDATLMIGHDDERWDVAATVPIAVVEEIVRQVERAP